MNSINTSARELAGMIDHTLLKADAKEAEIAKLCAEAAEHGFWSVCVNPTRIPDAVRLLAGTPVKICTVIGFPLGANLSGTKATEAVQAIQSGAHEVDMVMNIGHALDGKWDSVEADICAVVQAASGTLVKVILEVCYLTPEQIRQASEISVAAGADFVKTSTGFGPGGATAEALGIMRRAVGSDKGVKASGGIRDLATFLAMKEAGANRIGASASVAIVTGAASSSAGY